MLSPEIGSGDATGDDGACDIDVEWSEYDPSIPESVITRTIQDQRPDTAGHDKAM